MKVTTKLYWLIATAITCYFYLTYCKRTPHSDLRQKDTGQSSGSALQVAELPRKREPVMPSKLVVGEPQRPPMPNGFSGKELLHKLGDPLATSLLDELQKSGGLLEMPEAALESQGKSYGLGIHSGGGLIVYLGKDNSLLAFSYASAASETPSDEEQNLLMEFVLSDQPIVTVLDEKFEAVKMQIKKYESKVSPKKHAVEYSQGKSRAVVFFDSTRVEMRKLLPASPDTIDPAMLKQLRSLLEPPK